jgi:glycosyltransferase involved in cell wall biosynthesis
VLRVGTVVRRQGVDGWVVDPGSPAAIAQCLAQILTQRERLRAMGQAARAKSLTEFGVQRFVGRTLDIYDRVLATNHQRAGAAGTSH